MTVHLDRFLVNKTKRRTEFQLYYWYFDCTCFGQFFYQYSGVSQPYNGIGTFYAVQWPCATGNTPPPNCIKCTNAVVRLRNSWWWAERLPETCRVEIQIINLELSASVGFIHKEYIQCKQVSSFFSLLITKRLHVILFSPIHVTDPAFSPSLILLSRF
jgi:hypothetical protein